MNVKQGFMPIIVGIILAVAMGVVVYVNKEPYQVPAMPEQVTGTDTAAPGTVSQGTTPTKPVSGSYNDDDSDDEDDDDYQAPPRTTPTQPAPAPVPAPTPAPTPTPTPTPAPSGITLAQIAQHNSDASCWSAISGNVYDLTSWIPNHPGGENTIRRICGKDGSSDYSRQHGRSSRVAGILVGFKIGTLAQ